MKKSNKLFNGKYLFVFVLLVSFIWIRPVPVILGARVSGETGITPSMMDDEGNEQPSEVAEPAESAEPAASENEEPEQAVAPAPEEPEEQMHEFVPPVEEEPFVPERRPASSLIKPAVTKGAEQKKPVIKEEGDKRYVTIDFDDVEISVLIKFISELTGKNFVIDKGVRGKVTIISPTKISVDEAYRVFESVLEVHGFSCVPSGNIVKIVPAVEARSKDILTQMKKEGLSSEDKVVTQLIPLRYAEVDEIKKVLLPLISKSSIIVSYAPSDMLIITDVLSNIKRLMKIIDVIDVEGTGEQISVIPLKFATASALSKTLTDIFQKSRGKPRRGVAATDSVKITSDERTNVLIVLASEDDTQRIKSLIDLIDKETPKGEGDIRVYYLQNANAADLAKVLESLLGSKSSADQKGKPTDVISKDVKITSDTATNSLVITSLKDDYIYLEEVIKKLDIPRRMVYIEALLMEVSVNKGFNLGVEWQLAENVGKIRGNESWGYGGFNPTRLPSIDTTSGTVKYPGPFSFGVIGEVIEINGLKLPSIGAVIDTIKTDSEVNILSTPQIMTTDNEEAEIKVGKNIPFLTRQDTTSGTSDINYSNYDYKDVGVNLKITPQINKGRTVRLKISQEVSQLLEDESTVGKPTTLKRMVNTTVIIKDGHTIVIGGLIDQTLNDSKSQVPCLGDIPGLGELFKSVSNSKDKTNLFVFITPHIIESPEEAKAIYDQKKNEIDDIKEGVIKLYEKPNTSKSGSGAGHK